MWNVTADGKVAFAFATAGVVLAAAFTAWVLYAPAYDGGLTVLDVNGGLLTRLAIAAPIVVASFIWLMLHLACRRNSRAFRAVGLIAAWLVLGFSYIAGFSIGLAVVPAGVALLVAALMTPVTRPPAA